jgi:ribosomal protein S8
MHKVINSINNAFRYKKNSFKVKKNSKTILFLKCLVKSNVIRYFKEEQDKKTKEIFFFGYINPTNQFQIKLLSKGGRKIYLSNQNLKTDIFCFFIITSNIEKSYLNSFEKETKLSGELVAKVFI